MRDVFKLLIGIVFTLVGLIITILQVRARTYNKKGDFNWGNVQLTSAAIISWLAGIYLINIAL